MLLLFTNSLKEKARFWLAECQSTKSATLRNTMMTTSSTGQPCYRLLYSTCCSSQLHLANYPANFTTNIPSSIINYCLHAGM